MQISSLPEELQVALAIEAIKLTAYLEAACTIDAAPEEDDSTESWTILPGNRGRKTVLLRIIQTAS